MLKYNELPFIGGYKFVTVILYPELTKQKLSWAAYDSNTDKRNRSVHIIGSRKIKPPLSSS